MANTPFPAICRSITHALLALLTSSVALAADPASEQLRDQQRELQHLQQQQRLEQWQRRSAPQTLERQAPSAAPAEQCWPVSGLRLSGNRRVTNTALEQSLRPLLHGCMGPADINRLLLAITERYVQAGYPASRPYLARQPGAGMPLDIVIIEGFVESIALDNALPLSLASAFPGMLGQPLHLPDLEQGLDQLNRLRAYDLGANVRPGDLPGGTHIQIEPRHVSSRWHLDSRLDNRGSALTGRHRLSLTLGLDSPLSLNDDLRVSLLSTVFDAPGRSQGASLYYSLPYGPWTFALNASQLQYRAPLPGSQLGSHGNSSLQGLSVERMLWRNQQGMLNASLRLDHKRVATWFGPLKVAQQSPVLTTLEAGINLFWLEAGLWNAYLGIAQGIDWLGADREPLGRKSAEPGFRKYRATLLYLNQGKWRWQSELNLQYSPDRLPAIEQLALSDDLAVRGFRQHSVSGASGAVWRNTLSRPLSVALPLEIRPHLGLDLGWTRFDHGSSPQRMVGATLGVMLSTPSQRLRLDYQRALSSSDLPRGSLEPGVWVLEWNLSI
ncbi:TPA: ShlB/FhaC/HecB family hemolysin secretion/activation protein [Pseudomonas putida]|nr:ShlB/FhaC/HecB family hemolysin secretion/activation protein [Pseudomonas putida]